ncbi:unnamed protein product [Heligmosomoides polygyrus]|uniref:Exocyst complex component Sec10 n=1 Tax=Heligmosomoides polygyrus TaxID=6339 RepID=A0A3P8DFL6_HELPZ|nr:unnamed protein product [Heligmosomoides polygyrus]
MSFEFDLTAPFLPEFSTKDQSEHRHKIRPVQALLRQSTTATHRAVNAIREAERAKKSLHHDINSLTTSFDSTIQKSLALIDRLDESVYSGRIDNAQKRERTEKEASAIVQQAYSNPIENADLRLFERTVDVLREYFNSLFNIAHLKDSAIGLHREFFAYDGTVDAKDILAQVIEYKYRTAVLEKKLRSRRDRTHLKPLQNLSDILDEINECLEEFQIAEAPIRTKAVNVMHTVSGMKAKLSMGIYGSVHQSSGSSNGRRTRAKTKRKGIDGAPQVVHVDLVPCSDQIILH